MNWHEKNDLKKTMPSVIYEKPKMSITTRFELESDFKTPFNHTHILPLWYKPQRKQGISRN